MKPELIFYNGAKLLEAPYWDSKNSILYFVAIRYNAVFAFNTETLDVHTYKTEGPVGGAVVDCNGNLLVAEKHGIYTLNPDTKEKTFIAHLFKSDQDMRYNHLICDSRGRILVDVMGDKERYPNGGLYSIDNGVVKNLIFGTTVANGIAFSNNEKVLYFTDSVTKKVMAYDYDIETGNITNERVVIEFGEQEGKPDGLYVDLDDMLWVTEWDGGKLSKWDTKTFEQVNEIQMPCRHVTACCLGGKSMEYMYIATAKIDDNEAAPAGGLFRIKVR